jgi:polysaccharide export outer membrane protein
MRLFFLFLSLVLGATAALAQDGYALKPGDVLRIEVLEDPTLNRDTLILPDGSISLPLAGLVRAGGRGIDDVQADIAQRLAPNFASPPTVFVGIARLAVPGPILGAGGGAAAAPPGVAVFLMGEAANPARETAWTATEVGSTSAPCSKENSSGRATMRAAEVTHNSWAQPGA